MSSPDTFTLGLRASADDPGVGTQTSSPEGLVRFPSCLWGRRACRGRKVDKGEGSSRTRSRQSAAAPQSVSSLYCPSALGPGSLVRLRHQARRREGTVASDLKRVWPHCTLQSTQLCWPGGGGISTFTNKEEDSVKLGNLPVSSRSVPFGVCVRPEGLGGPHSRFAPVSSSWKGLRGPGHGGEPPRATAPGPASHAFRFPSVQSPGASSWGATPATPQACPRGLGSSHSFAGLGLSLCPQDPCGGVTSLQTVLVPVCWETGHRRGSVRTVPGPRAGAPGSVTGAHTPSETFFELRDPGLRCSECKFLRSSLFLGERSGAVG